jgi:flagellar biogenesis protein FliO
MNRNPDFPLFSNRMSFSSDVLPLILSLLAVVAVLYVCYLFSRFLGRRVGKVADSNNIRILERVALSQDKGLVIAEICGGLYLIGFSSSSVSILKELDASLLRRPPAGMKQNFMDVLNTALKGRLDWKGNDNDDHGIGRN